MGYLLKIHVLSILWLLMGADGTVSTKPLQHFNAVANDPVSEDLFKDEKILNIKISGELRNLFNDRADQSKYHPVVLSYKGADSSEIKIPLKARTRGHFRKSMGDCTYPPVLLNFASKDTPAKSLFAGQNKLKLVMPCQGDQYVVREWMIYKLYNLVTDKSYKARLVRVEIDDSQRKKKSSPFYGILLEEDGQMAKRNKMVSVKRNLLKMNQAEQSTFLKMAVFEYLIGNTDWSVEYQQNVELIARDASSIAYTVPYDFDHAGLVSAPYAHPAEELDMTSVRERRFRGYCMPNMSEFKDVFEFYTKLKDRIYELYRSNTYLDAKYVKSTLDYFDDFYKTIGDEKKAKSAFGYPCDKNGTGNIIIKGLKKN